VAQPLDQNELDFLRSAADLTARQQELYKILTEAIGADPYDFWVLNTGADGRGWLARRRYRRRRERLAGGEFGGWSWSFHGLECDMRQLVDGRFVRIDFGPTTRRSVITGWGVLQYLMCAKPPWRRYTRLQEHLAEKGPPYDSLSGSHEKMACLCDRLQRLQLLVPADTELLALGHEFSVNDPTTGATVIDIPPELEPAGQMDVYLSARLVVSDTARTVLAERPSL